MPDARNSRPKSLLLDRREWLVAVGSLAAALGLPGAMTAAAQSGEAVRQTDAFTDVSVALTGFSPAGPDLASQFIDAFRSESDGIGRLHDIIRLQPPDQWDASIAAAGLTALAQAIMTAWYTGAVVDGADRKVITYLDAFAWSAVGYTKPPTRCAEAFGGWALAPHEDR
jgi:hypothetical protein